MHTGRVCAERCQRAILRSDAGFAGRGGWWGEGRREGGVGARGRGKHGGGGGDGVGRGGGCAADDVRAVASGGPWLCVYVCMRLCV